ncbi:hypothetical protein E2C01_065507 [Portunus trituberculatus]|uniref:Uncharacterized protein n=1 Tax=Portunus trituberculatus TaxID=210409 RepID=A0A5B7HNK3_PORTR|nr:hypothetical protein [Portunus trituberculatus]
MGHGAWNREHETWDRGHGTWDMRHRTWDRGHGTGSMGQKAWGTGQEQWDMVTVDMGHLFVYKFVLNSSSLAVRNVVHEGGVSLCPHLHLTPLASQSRPMTCDLSSHAQAHHGPVW